MGGIDYNKVDPVINKHGQASGEISRGYSGSYDPLIVFGAGDMLGLFSWVHVAVDYSCTTEVAEGNGHVGFGDCVHGS
jgi:diadenosine tetraphosphatase ApaH/serine/threonine PP2A family protein phosphatase